MNDDNDLFEIAKRLKGKVTPEYDEIARRMKKKRQRDRKERAGKPMSEERFNQLANMADSFRRPDTGTSREANFWQGYIRGLYRAYYGADFGMEGEHRRHLALIDEVRDLARLAVGIGYRAGLRGAGLEECKFMLGVCKAGAPME